MIPHSSKIGTREHAFTSLVYSCKPPSGLAPIFDTSS
jgi:hypothetical protein